MNMPRRIRGDSTNETDEPGAGERYGFRGTEPTSAAPKGSMPAWLPGLPRLRRRDWTIGALEEARRPARVESPRSAVVVNPRAENVRFPLDREPGPGALNAGGESQLVGHDDSLLIWPPHPAIFHA